MQESTGKIYSESSNELVLQGMNCGWLYESTLVEQSYGTYARGDNLPLMDSLIGLGTKARLEIEKQKSLNTSMRLKSNWICGTISHR